MENNELQRGLNARQMQMIALGGTIGVGLFMGATSTIKWTGPSVILAYLIAGIFLFLIMRAMGEMIYLSLIHISEPTRHSAISRMPSSA